ncbi:Outer membrane efflux protein [Rubripirellula lacrimiformis]|uniref:Outer membrane efflux protein n=1 Tax=Rubripirellula lacrimiformis TaxID=1930273 RepID=A0A517N8T1_9BACT|nr:TolC family protein [Rubripirellula lacrimiformis]QDT03408.1 Outer membrane efflux protein [Rubripirellula lacrimiformis]
MFCPPPSLLTRFALTALVAAAVGSSGAAADGSSEQYCVSPANTFDHFIDAIETVDESWYGETWSGKPESEAVIDAPVPVEIQPSRPQSNPWVSEPANAAISTPMEKPAPTRLGIGDRSGGSAPSVWDRPSNPTVPVAVQTPVPVQKSILLQQPATAGSQTATPAPGHSAGSAEALPQASPDDDVAGDNAVNGLDDFELFHQQILRAQPAEAWSLTLAEAVRLGLANNKEVSVLSPKPGVAAAMVSIERGAFDPVTGVSTFGGKDNRQVRSEIATFGAPVSSQKIDYFRPQNGRNQLYLRQQLATGGQYEVGVGTNYLNYFPDAPELIVPSGWESALNFEFHQPLFRGRGRAAAQRNLRVAAARQRQSEFDFQVQLREIVRDIDLVYWELAGISRRAKVAKAFVELANEYAKQEDARKDLGQSARPQVLQTASVLNEFRVDLEKTRRDQRVAEMRLRTELGLAMMMQQNMDALLADDQMFLPIDTATLELESISPADVTSDIARAMTRPEIAESGARIEEARANLAAAKNKLLPDVQAHALYSKVGLNKGLDDSVSTVFEDGFHTWGAGVSYERRLRQRSEHAEVRQFHFQLAHEQARQNEIAHDIVGKLRELSLQIEGSFRILAEAKDYVRVLTEQQIVLGELYKDGKVGLFQRLENVRALQAAELDMHDKWIDLAKAIALYRYERGDNVANYDIQIDVVDPVLGDSDGSVSDESF